MILNVEELMTKKKLTNPEKITFLCLVMTITSQSFSYLKSSVKSILPSEDIPKANKRRK